MARFPTLSTVLFWTLICTSTWTTVTTNLQYDSDGWKAASDFLLDAIDPKAKPCRNFYRFACGGWQKKYGENFSGEPEKVRVTVVEQLLTALKGISSRSNKKYERNLKVFYDQCVNSTDDEEVVVEAAYHRIKQLLGPMPLFAEVTKEPLKIANPFYLMGQLQRYMNIKLFMEANVEQSSHQCEVQPIILLRPPPDTIAAFSPNITQMLVRLGNKLGVALNPAEVQHRVEHISEFARDLYRLSTHRFPLDSFSYRLSNLTESVNRNVTWRAYFAGLLPSKLFQTWRANNPLVALERLHYFKNLDQIMDELTYADLLDYAFVRALDTYVDSYFKVPELLQDDVAELDWEHKCLEYVLKYASAAATRVYFESIRGDPMKWKHDLELIAETVFAALRFMIHTADWMDVDDKAAISEKVNSIRFNSVIPDWLLNNKAVWLHTPAYRAELSVFENDFRMFRRKSDWQFRPLLTGRLLPTAYRMERDRYYLDADPNFGWNAYYFERVVNVYLGLTLPPIYNYSYPLAVKFGVLGFVIGHELFHSFDSERIGGEPSVRHWLKEATLRMFQKRTKCIVKQYSGYCDLELNKCVSGDQTLNDNIADMEGLKVAYMAYKFMQQTVGAQPPLPGLTNYTNDQLFFLSAARIWCSSGDDSGIYADEHAPNRARVELAAMNFPAFAQAFRCPTGERFAPIHTCQLWGDFLEPKRRK